MKFAIALALMIPLAVMAQAPDKSLEERARAVVTKDLLDPYSAVMENLRVTVSPKGSTVVCGTVNAKNRMGGYIGRQPFFYIDGEAGKLGFGLIGGESSSTWRGVVENYCGT